MKSLYRAGVGAGVCLTCVTSWPGHMSFSQKRPGQSADHPRRFVLYYSQAVSVSCYGGGPMLTIQLLGQFRVTMNGRPVSLPARPTQLLLAWLALHVGTPQPRELLADRLWPGSSAENGRANLRHALWQLRAAIEPDGGEGHTYLLVDPHTIAFNPDSPYTLDTDALTRERPVWATADLLAAVAVYGGELLPGFYEAWIVLERERLAAIHERRMTALLDHLSMERRWEEAMAWAERWIALGEAPEPAYRALMRAYAARGDAGHAMAAYQRCRQALSEALGVEPSDETRRLAEALRVAGAHPAAEIEPPLPADPAAALDFERRRADLYLRSARRSNRLALGALLGLATMVGVAIAARRR